MCSLTITEILNYQLLSLSIFLSLWIPSPLHTANNFRLIYSLKKISQVSFQQNICSRIRKSLFPFVKYLFEIGVWLIPFGIMYRYPQISMVQMNFQELYISNCENQ